MDITQEFKNVDLCIVSKNRSHEEIMKYYNLGYRVFGENKAQELLNKISLPKDIKWHFIGHLQKNKVRKILPHLSMIQSIDNLELIKEIEKEASKINKTIDVLIEFNLAKEASKTGLKEEVAFDFFKQALKYPHINIRGIMLMGPNTDDEAKIRQVFQQGYQLFNKLKKIAPSIDTLSMGMSNDYKIAMEEGCTMVRIGSLLF